VAVSAIYVVVRDRSLG